MARKITMFELHFDGVSFGRSPEMAGEESTPEMAGEESTPGMAGDGSQTGHPEEAVDLPADGEDAPASGSRARKTIVALGIVGLVTLVGRRMRRGRAETDDRREIDVESPASDDESAEIPAER